MLPSSSCDSVAEERLLFIVFAEQNLRELTLYQMGWIVVRLEWRDLSVPSLVLHKIASALERMGRELQFDSEVTL